MALKEKQILITKIVGKILGQEPDMTRKFEWFINKHNKIHFGEKFKLIDNIFNDLGGDIVANQNKKQMLLDCDAYFGGKYNFFFEFDEFQHFSSARLKTLMQYQKEIKLNFNVEEWIKQCKKNKHKADEYRKAKTTTDFNFSRGRTAQRAYLDCFRDFLPEENGLNPTLRINEFEVEGIYLINDTSLKILDNIIKQKLKYL